MCKGKWLKNGPEGKILRFGNKKLPLEERGRGNPPRPGWGRKRA